MRAIKEDLLDAIRSAQIEPIADDEITAAEAAALWQIGVECARRRLDRQVAAQRMSKRVALSERGHRVMAYRLKESA